MSAVVAAVSHVASPSRTVVARPRRDSSPKSSAPCGKAPSTACAWFAEHAAELASRLRVAFHRLAPEARAEAAADCTARIWEWLLSAERRGTLHRVTPFRLVTYARASWFVGRRFVGMSSTDVMGEAAGWRGRVNVVSLDDGATPELSPSETIPDKRSGGNPFEDVRRNCDYPYILEADRVSAKARRAFALLAQTMGGLKNLELAAELGVSPGRATQLKTRLADALARHDYRCPPVRCGGRVRREWSGRRTRGSAA